MPVATHNTQKRDQLLKQLAAVRAETDRLFSMVNPSARYDRPIPERHRIIFYRGHLEAFDWNLLQPRLPGVKTFDPTLDRLFAFGIDPIDGKLPSDQPSDWPAEAQVEEYCGRNRAALDRSLSGSDFEDSMVLHVALEHRLMHAETLAYMLHQLPGGQKRSQAQAAVAATAAPAAEMIGIPRGPVTLGLQRSEAFGWDNEYDAHVAQAPSFEIDRFKVTNRDYLRFMDAGGYQNRDLWTEDGWNWIRSEEISHPVFWKRGAEDWRYRTMFDEISLPLDWPAYVSHAEASAFARWSGKRLPAEVEWQRACTGTPDGNDLRFPWGDASPGPEHGYFDFERWDPWAVNAFPASASAFGVEGMMANGWEWTSSVFEPFQGFEPFSFYPGYSANFFDGQHYVMKGGSTRTAECMLRSTFRNWFQPHYPYVYAGFRCARS